MFCCWDSSSTRVSGLQKLCFAPDLSPQIGSMKAVVLYVVPPRTVMILTPRRPPAELSVQESLSGAFKSERLLGRHGVLCLPRSVLEQRTVTAATSHRIAQSRCTARVEYLQYLQRIDCYFFRCSGGARRRTVYQRGSSVGGLS